MVKRVLGGVVAGAVVVVLAGGASAQMGGGRMPGGAGGGHMGSGMMGGGQGQGEIPTLTEDAAQRAAAEYTAQHLPGFVVQRVLPLTGMHMTMYQAELSGPGGEARTLHINPWGAVMPVDGPVTR